MKPRIFITTDTPTKLAWVRGPDAEKVTAAVCRLERRNYLSGAGWLIPTSLVDDVLAYCQWSHLLVVCHERRREAS